MIRTVLAASLILGAGGAFARDVPVHLTGPAGVTHPSGDTTGPGLARAPIDRRVRRDVGTTGAVLVRPAPQRVMGLPVPGQE